MSDVVHAALVSLGDRGMSQLSGRLVAVHDPVIRADDGDVICLLLTVDSHYKCYRYYRQSYSMKIEKKVSTGGQSKKSQGGNISPIWGEAPTVPIETDICMTGNLPDVITYAKFQDEIFRGYDFTGGRISHFPIDFCMGLNPAPVEDTLDHTSTPVSNFSVD